MYLYNSVQIVFKLHIHNMYMYIGTYTYIVTCHMCVIKYVRKFKTHIVICM